MAGRPKWQEEMQAAADATGKMFSVGLRPNKNHSWWAHCDGVEWDASSPQGAVKAVVDSLRQRAEREYYEALKTAETLKRQLGLVDTVD